MECSLYLVYLDMVSAGLGPNFIVGSSQGDAFRKARVFIEDHAHAEAISRVKATDSDFAWVSDYVENVDRSCSLFDGEPTYVKEREAASESDPVETYIVSYSSEGSIVVKARSFAEAERIFDDTEFEELHENFSTDSASYDLVDIQRAEGGLKS